MMKWPKFVIYLAAALILAIIIKNAAGFLVISQPPRKAGVIIVLRGGAGDDRTMLGVDLYRQGYAPYLLFTSATGQEKSQAMAGGVPEKAIILDRKAQNTYQNATDTKALMEQYGFRSAIVVSSDYHMRRARLIFTRVFRGSGTTLTFVAVKDPGFHTARWWTSRQTILHMCWEYGGIAAFYLGLGPRITGAWVHHSVFGYLFRNMH